MPSICLIGCKNVADAPKVHNEKMHYFRMSYYCLNCVKDNGVVYQQYTSEHMNI